MSWTQTISQVSEHSKLNGQQAASILLNKDLWLGECLGDYLFKLCGTDQVVWIPCQYISHSNKHDHSFVARIPLEEHYSCARLMISNTIRMCLFDQHPVVGKKLLPYLMKS